MTKEQQLALLEILIETLDENNLDVDVIRAISQLKRKVNEFSNPTFVESGKSVMEHYEEFTYTGLNNSDYVNTGFYKSGFDEDVIVTKND